MHKNDIWLRLCDIKSSRIAPSRIQDRPPPDGYSCVLALEGNRGKGQ